MNFQNYRKIILNSWKLAIKCNEATKYSSFSPRFNNYRLNVLEFFVIHVSIFLLLLLLLSNLRISRTGSTMTSASLRYPKPKVDRARNGEEEGKGREGDSFSPGCPLSSHRRHLLFDPSQSRRRKRPRAKRGRFIWMRDASVAAFSFSLSFWHLASRSRCMDHPDASSVDCSSYECSSAKKKFDPFLKRVWIFFFFFFLRARGRMLQISKEIGKLDRSEKLKLEEVWNIADGFIIARGWRLVVSWVKFL